ncbi:endoglucanase, partial [Lactobacillus sp. XV13L]|nr:endoglucanase [Lactobacillus sp. XV13L]
MKVQSTTANFSIPGIYFSGRWAQTEHGLYTTNLGAQLYTQVTQAQQVELSFSTKAQVEGVFIAYQVDFGKFQRANLAQTPLTITLPDLNSHILRVVYSGNTPADNVWKRHGGLYFDYLKVAPTAQLTPIKPAGPALSFIGDSITAGSWVHGKTAGQDYCAEGNFAALTANELNMEDIRIAYPGAGLVKPGSGGVPTASEFLEKIDAEHSWSVQPSEYVVINLGTPDRKANEIEFRAAWELFLQKVQLLYPQTPKLVMIPFSQRHAQVIREETVEYPGFQLLETADWDLTYT